MNTHLGFATQPQRLSAQQIQTIATNWMADQEIATIEEVDFNPNSNTLYVLPYLSVDEIGEARVAELREDWRRYLDRAADALS